MEGGINRRKVLAGLGAVALTAQSAEAKQHPNTVVEIPEGITEVLDNAFTSLATSEEDPEIIELRKFLAHVDKTFEKEGSARELLRETILESLKEMVEGYRVYHGRLAEALKDTPFFVYTARKEFIAVLETYAIVFDENTLVPPLDYFLSTVSKLARIKLQQATK